jgi:hypothetical protein
MIRAPGLRALGIQDPDPRVVDRRDTGNGIRDGEGAVIVVSGQYRLE